MTQLTNVTDTQTDRQTHTQTPHDGIGRAYASHRAAKMGQIRLRQGFAPDPCGEHTTLPAGPLLG